MSEWPLDQVIIGENHIWNRWNRLFFFSFNLVKCVKKSNFKIHKTHVYIILWTTHCIHIWKPLKKTFASLMFISLQYEDNGFAVIEDFFTEKEANELREAGLDLCKNAPENDRITFANAKSKSSHLNNTYFLNSSNKIHYFYESNALDANGNLLVDKSVSLNKVRLKINSSFELFFPDFDKNICLSDSMIRF